MTRVDSEPALTDVSLLIKAGEKIAICGRSGRYNLINIIRYM